MFKKFWAALVLFVMGPEPSTEQKIFDKTLFFLRRQGVASMDADGFRCRYRGAKGRMCAAGCQIPDAEYAKHYRAESADGEGERVNSLEDKGVVLNTRFFASLGFDENQRVLLQMMQSAHDKYMPRPHDVKLPDRTRSIPLWEAEMQRIAKVFKVYYTPSGFLPPYPAWPGAAW